MSDGAWTIGRLEDHLFAEEEVRVVFRTLKDIQIPAWPFKNSIGDGRSVIELHERIEKTYPSIPFVIVDGRGAVQHLRGKKLATVRESYQ